MAAPDTSLSRLGQINQAGQDDALFLKQFGGEILTEFERNNVFKARHFVRQIRNGKSAQFPLIGTVASSMRTPGTWIDGAAVNHAEVVLSIDGLLVAPHRTADGKVRYAFARSTGHNRIQTDPRPNNAGRDLRAMSPASAR